MASRDIDVLIPSLRPKVRELLQKCLNRGIEMRPSQTLRDPFEQAKLWRQSRSREQIEQKIAEFRASSAGFLADCLESVGPQHGNPVTNSGPGLSWHQWGEAMDCFWLVNGEAEWSSRKLVNGVNGYQVYAEEAERLGLIAGGLWPRFKDWPHVQFRREDNPRRTMTLTQINDEMRRRFGTQG